MPRVLLLLPTTTYRTEAFLAAAVRLGVDVTVASERANTLSHLNRASLLTLDFQDPGQAAQQAIEFSAVHRIDAVVPADSQVVVVGAAIAAALKLRYHSVESASAATDKHRMRQRLEHAGVPCPPFRLCSFDEDHDVLAARATYPCVVKPLSLAASQGVIRADDAAQFLQAVSRLEQIVKRAYEASGNSHDSGLARTATVPARGSKGGRLSHGHFLVEQFVGGPEVALEGMLTRGDLRVLALLDKPDPLDGPYFEETIYLTPSRLATGIQDAVAQCTQQAARALGLTEGPIHAELRLTQDGPSVIEINARSIGGLCSRMLRFGTGLSLEELIIRHALTEDFELPPRQRQASGAMMIPIPRAGRLVETRGLEAAKAVRGIEDVRISAHPGQQLVPLPEGAQYLGFIFASAVSPALVETALRRSHAQLEFVIEPTADRAHHGELTSPSVESTEDLSCRN